MDEVVRVLKIPDDVAVNDVLTDAPTSVDRAFVADAESVVDAEVLKFWPVRVKPPGAKSCVTVQVPMVAPPDTNVTMSVPIVFLTSVACRTTEFWNGEEFVKPNIVGLPVAGIVVLATRSGKGATLNELNASTLKNLEDAPPLLGVIMSVAVVLELKITSGALGLGTREPDCATVQFVPSKEVLIRMVVALVAT